MVSKRQKIVPKDLLLTPEMLAIWYCDDGYNIQNHKIAGICSQSFTHDECLFLSKEIDNLVGIKSHVIPSNQIMIYSKQYFIFMEFIKPYIIWDCMKYKCDISNVKALSYSSGEKHHNAKLDWKKVEHIRSLNGLSISELSILYKVSKKTIKNVIAGKVWKAEKGLAEEAEKMESII